MNEYAQEIRRIAKGDKVKGPLGNALERDPINGTFVPFTNTPQSQITANGAEGEDPADVNSVPSNNAGSDPTDLSQQNDQPVTSDDPNTFNQGSAAQGSTSNTYDMEDIVDQTGDVPSSPNEADNSGSDETASSPTSGIVSHINGATDCSTGQCINFHLDGNFPAPDGWPDADTPADAEGYETWDPDYYWRTQVVLDHGTISVEAATYEVAYNNLVAAIQADPDIESFGINFELYQVYEGRWAFSWSAADHGIGTGVVNTDILRYDCVSVGDPSEDGCISEVPKAEAWPEDGCYDLALIDGQFQKNEYDSEAPSDAGGSKVDFCFGDGRTGSMEVTANGGMMVYETSGGSPTGQATVYGADGTMQAAGNATETFMDQWRTK